MNWDPYREPEAPLWRQLWNPVSLPFGVAGLVLLGCLALGVLAR